MGLTDHQLIELGKWTLTALDHHAAVPQEITAETVVNVIKKRVEKLEGENDGRY